MIDPAHLRNDVLSTFSSVASTRMSSQDNFWIESVDGENYGVFERNGERVKVFISVQPIPKGEL